jgi:hypothetical protein
MNKFVFVAQTRDGQVHIGTCKAPAGDSARQIIKQHFGDELVSFDFKGVTSDTLMVHRVQCTLQSNRDEPTLRYHGDGG